MAAWIPRKHHRGSIRLAGYDYTQPGAYFITICTQDRACLFGEVVVKEMLLNDAGRLVQAVWEELPNHYPHVTLDAWVIMPNHVHGIVVIGENDPNGNKSDPMPNGKMRTATHGGPGGMTVGATHASPLIWLDLSSLLRTFCQCFTSWECDGGYVHGSSGRGKPVSSTTDQTDIRGLDTA